MAVLRFITNTVAVSLFVVRRYVWHHHGRGVNWWLFRLMATAEAAL